MPAKAHQRARGGGTPGAAVQRARCLFSLRQVSLAPGIALSRATTSTAVYFHVK